MSQQVGANPGMPLIRPEQIQGLPHISEETKQQYRNGLANLWQKLEHSQAGSKEHTDALDKIRTASTKLMGMISGKAGNGMRPGSGGGQQRPGSQQMGGQQQQQQGNAPQLAAAQGQQGPQQQGQRPVGQQGQPPWTPKQQHELDSINIVQPGNVSGQQWESYRTQLQNGLRDAIMKRDFAFQRYNQLQLQIRSHQQSNKAVPEKAHAQLVEFRKLAEVATNNFRVFKVRAAGADHNQAMAQVQAQAQQAQQQQQQQRANAQQGSAQQQQQSQQSDAKPANGPGRNSLSPPQYQNGFQQAQNQQGAPGQMTQQNMQQAPVAPQPQQSSPQSATQPQQGFQQNLAQQQPQHPNQQPRPAQINTQQIQPQHQQQQQGTPASAMPPSATQQNPQRPQPLTHSAAMSQAAESYNRSQQQTQQQPQAAVQVPQAMPPFNTNQGSGPPQSKDQASYPNLQTTTNSSTNPNSKFPIPRTLQLDPRNQAPVAGPPSRPSLAYSGMMSQPAMQRAPPYTLEGEGDRVLSKRKLDELVRQVTGAAPSSDNSESSSVLAPDVEESIMEVADNFVDEVITSACRLAKLRPNQTLDLRDVQMVLERNYGIRIPGYGLDETRTVRKFNPAPGWQNKMQAVQAGKVMGNRDS